MNEITAQDILVSNICNMALALGHLCVCIYDDAVSDMAGGELKESTD